MSRLSDDVVVVKTIEESHWYRSAGNWLCRYWLGRNTLIHSNNNTPWAIKKRATLFLIITLAFLGRFLHFLHQWKEEGLIYTSLKNLPLHPNYVSTLPGKTKTTYKQHILKSIITVRSIEPVVSNLRRKSSNVHIFQFLVGNSFIIFCEKHFYIPASFWQKN